MSLELFCLCCSAKALTIHRSCSPITCETAACAAVFPHLFKTVIYALFVISVTPLLAEARKTFDFFLKQIYFILFFIQRIEKESRAPSLGLFFGVVGDISSILISSACVSGRVRTPPELSQDGRASNFFPSSPRRRMTEQ